MNVKVAGVWKNTYSRFNTNLKCQANISANCFQRTKLIPPSRGGCDDDDDIIVIMLKYPNSFWRNFLKMQVSKIDFKIVSF